MQESESTLKSVTQRLELTEKRLSELISFFSRVASNPAVLAQMITTAQQNQAYLAGSDARRKKRRADGGNDDSPPATGGQLIPYQPVDVASFFQNLMVSPLPDMDDTAAAIGADELEKHFNSIDLAATSTPGKSTRQESVQIHEASSADSPGVAALDMASGFVDGDAMAIEVPPALAGGMPTIGVSNVGIDLNRDNGMGAAAAVDQTTVGGDGIFAQTVTGAAGIPSATDAVVGNVMPPFSSSLPEPDRFSLDDLDLPGDLPVDFDNMGDFLKGGLETDLPDLKDDAWQHLTDVDTPTTPAAT